MITFGDRLKQARRLRGYTQQRLADQAGVTKQAISKYEHGLDAPSSGVLQRLSGALEMKPDFFFRRRTVTVRDPIFRHKRPLPRTEEKTIQARVQDWLERYVEAEELAEVEPGREPAIPALAHRRVHDLEGVEAAAEELRGRWDLGLDAIEDLTEMLEDKGLKVHLIEASDDFDALTFPTGGDAVIVGNARQPADRLRFSLAHELGHLVLEPAEGAEDAEGVDIEKAADRFAAAFLVPQATARRELGPKRHHLDWLELCLLKRKYGLSPQAWIHRAQDLGIIENGTADRHFEELKRLGVRDTPIGPDLPRERPKRMERLVRRALAEELISRSRAAELLGQSLAEFHEQERVQTDDARLAACL